VSSTHVSDQHETERAARKAVSPSRQQPSNEAQQRDSVIANKTKRVTAPLPGTLAQKAVPVSAVESRDDDTGREVMNRSTDASTQAVSIIELLHTKISEHKQYPYMAKRQRREGVARVAFVLHPDGSINDARLVHSSRTRTLDKAALEAVQGIEPFIPAKDYLHQPEAFQVDVVFNMI
jgi:TonB family protein